MGRCCTGRRRLNFTGELGDGFRLTGSSNPHFFSAEALPYHLAKPGEPFLLAADLDGTLLGDELGEAWIKALRRQSAQDLRLAYVTGRGYALVQEPIDAGRLPAPDFICCDVGSTIYDLSDPQNHLGSRYAAQAGPAWNPAAVFALGEGEGVRRQSLAGGSDRFRASFDWDGQPGSLKAFYQRMESLPFCRILPSHGRYIDVLPVGLGKGQAVAFLSRELGLSDQWVVVAGDSGNDLEMFETAFQGIVVANALDELKAGANLARHYHSPLPAGRGVLDGLHYFGFLKKTPIA